MCLPSSTPPPHTHTTHRQLLQQWAKQWAAPYFLCSDQLQFRHWTNDVWLDWIPDSFAERLSTDNVTVTLASLRHAVSATAAPGSKVGYSDAVRFFVLFKYGGIYTDGDVLLLRSMQPLAHLDFLYEWSFVRGGTNTAVFGLRRRSRFAGAVIQHALRQSLHVNGTNGQLTFDVRVFSSLFHPLSVLKRVSAEAREGVHTLPSILFDPVWLPLDANATKKHHPNNHAVLHCVRAWADVFVAPPAHLTLPASAREFFRGAFAHHWHNNWGQPLEPRSMMGQWVALYDRFLAGQALGAEGARYEDCSASPQTS
jgi:WD repeat and SOF domain-containing protein 1